MKMSVLEERFLELWEALGGCELVREYRFAPPRRWKADFACLEARVLIEIEGGVWNKGRHVNPKGFINDAEKYLTATLEGWTVIRLVSTQLTEDNCERIINYVRNRMAGCSLERSVETS